MSNIIDLSDYRKYVPSIEEQYLIREMLVVQQIMKEYEHFLFLNIAVACRKARNALADGKTADEALAIADEYMARGELIVKVAK